MAANVTQKIVGNKLVLEIDISPKALKDAPDSSTGKTRLVASTRGAIAVEGKDNLSFSLNVMVR